MGSGDTSGRDIPHGHGGSHKKGFADGLRGLPMGEASVPKTHQASYRRGYAEGQIERRNVAERVKP